MPATGSTNGAPIGAAVGAVASFCVNCGNQFGEGARFCESCGTKRPQSAQAPAEGAKNPIGAPFGRKTVWNTPEDPGDSRSSADPDVAAPRRSQWDERGDQEGAAAAAAAQKSSRPSMWDSRTSTVGGSGAAAPVGVRRSQWDDRGEGPDAADASTATATAPAARAAAAAPGAGSAIGAPRRSQWDQGGDQASAAGASTPSRPTLAVRVTPALASRSAAGGAAAAGRPVGAASAAGRPVVAASAASRPVVAASAAGRTVPGRAVPSSAAGGASATGATASGGAAAASSAGSATVFVQGIPPGATEAHLRRLFETAGVPVAAWQQRDKMSASVDIKVEAPEDPEITADFAVHRLNGATLFGRPLTVDVEQVSKGSGGVPKRKTQICQFWKESRCSRGPLCTFAHGEAELDTEVPPGATPPMAARAPMPVGASTPGAARPQLPRPVGAVGGTPPPMIRPPRPPITPAMSSDPKFVTNRKTQICLYWKEGRCTRGNQCSFAHGEEELSNDKDFRTGAKVAETIRAKLAKDKEDDDKDKGSKAGRDRERDRSRDRRGDRRDGRRGGRSRSAAKKYKRITFAKKDTLAAAVRAECKVVEDVKKVEGSDDDSDCKATSPDQSKAEGAPLPAPFLLNEDGLEHLTDSYGIGVLLLQAMGWKAGSGLGRKAEGWLEPISVSALEHQLTRRGRKDRRCLGVKMPKKFLDSDASESAKSMSVSSRQSSSSKSSKRSSSKSSRRHKNKKRRRKKRTQKRSRSKSSKSSSSSSSSRSGSSSSTRRRRRRKLRRTRATTSPPKAGAAAPGATSGPAAGGAAGAGTAGAAAGAAAVPGAKVDEPPEIQQAKKQVLAKLTVLKNVEPKEQRAKQFRELLREWHPDKNPERLEMATAVFQFLQKGKSLLSLGSK